VWRLPLGYEQAPSSTYFLRHGLKVPAYVHFSIEQWDQEEWKALDRIQHLNLPYVAKPVRWVSSWEFSLIDILNNSASADRVFAYDKGLIIQECVQEVEGTCGILDGGRISQSHCRQQEIIPKSSFLITMAKYKKEHGKLRPAVASEVM